MNNDNNNSPKNKVIARFLKYLWPKNNNKIKFVLLIALTFLLLSRVINVYVPLLFKDILDDLSNDNLDAIAVPVSVILSYGIARILSQFFSDLKDTLFIYLEQFATKAIALNIFKRVHELSLDFHISKKTGGLSRAIERGVSSIEMFMRFFVFIIGPAMLEILFVISVLLSMYDWRFTAVIAITIILYITYTLGVTQWRIKLMRLMNSEESNANSTSIDSILNYETVKYFNNEGHEIEKYDSAFSKYQKTAFSVKSSLAILNTGQSVIIAIGMILILYMAAKGIKNGSMTIGDMVLVNTYLLQLYMPLGNLGFSYRQIRMALVNMEEMFSIMNEKLDIKDQDGADELAINNGELSFEDVYFSYKEGRSALKGLTFTVPPKSTVAIVGPSGAGKSTISKLLFRFYDIDSGKIMIDGVNIKDITQESLRKAIGIVPQDTILFNDTIFYNIAYANLSASKEDVEKAAKLANIHDFIISTKDGYNSLVGERGMKISGGEKQRIAIARAILKNPNIYMFDEATSSLDSATEREIMQSIRSVSKDKTAIIIAHRLSTIIDADIIYVMEKGRVIESGNHKDLLLQKGVYYQMWKKQSD